ncbi:hypothetical protein AB9F36_34075, partial [Rhizobium leguminosarum]|uniref:hypothetical protein n=1 Tax=Rhizobium leguminosarum TaxID=384 RepID=UPI003F97A15E
EKDEKGNPKKSSKLWADNAIEIVERRFRCVVSVDRSMHLLCRGSIDEPMAGSQTRFRFQITSSAVSGLTLRHLTSL